MTKHKKNIGKFRVYPENEDVAQKLKIFNSIKRKQSFSLSSIAETSAVDINSVRSYVDNCVRQEILASEKQDLNGNIGFQNRQKKFLGISLEKDKCILTAIDLMGRVIDEDIININYLPEEKLKKKEISNIVADIRSGLKISPSEYCYSGIALPLGFGRDNTKNSVFFAEEISRIFGCDVFLSNEATASGYCEGTHSEKITDNGFLYLYLDIGVGAVFKDDVIFEAGEINFGKEIRYLRPWEQFSVVKAARELIKKGLGTTIVKTVNGDIDNITLDIVLTAADDGDELAEDLVKRASYALGVRAAYLVNMFDVDTIVLGGGIEENKGHFRDLIEESVSKFVMRKKADRLDIIPGEMGKEASSKGAALLCRRELFMEV